MIFGNVSCLCLSSLLLLAHPSVSANQDLFEAYSAYTSKVTKCVDLAEQGHLSFPYEQWNKKVTGEKAARVLSYLASISMKECYDAERLAFENALKKEDSDIQQVVNDLLPLHDVSHFPDAVDKNWVIGLKEQIQQPFYYSVVMQRLRERNTAQ
ncbi:hypothetical protein N9R79_12585 [Vibrio sp.]|nr:hypothetical protein [Vibrio sp.]